MGTWGSCEDAWAHGAVVEIRDEFSLLHMP